MSPRCTRIRLRASSDRHFDRPSFQASTEQQQIAVVRPRRGVAVIGIELGVEEGLLGLRIGNLLAAERREIGELARRPSRVASARNGSV